MYVDSSFVLTCNPISCMHTYGSEQTNNVRLSSQTLILVEMNYPGNIVIKLLLIGSIIDL